MDDAEMQKRLARIDLDIKTRGDYETVLNLDRLFFPKKDATSKPRLAEAAKWLSKAVMSDKDLNAEWMALLKNQIRDSVDKAKGAAKKS